MDIIHELRRVLEIHLDYMDKSNKEQKRSSSPLAAVRRDITRYQKQLSVLTPVSISLAALACIAAVATIIDAWIPWQYMGVLVIASFVIIIPTINVYQKLEHVKKREFFLFMLHKIDRS
jgi:Flp pilus assembly protein TadB